MKKIMIIYVVMIAVIGLLSSCVFTRLEKLGNINHSYSEPTTSSSEIAFSGETGERIKISFSSEITSGELDIFLYDSNGNAVYELDHARELEAFFTFDKTDEYILSAEYSDFVGNFNVKVYKTSV